MAQNFNGNLAVDGNITAINIPYQQFTDSSGATNYIGKNVGKLPLSAGTHIFTNCTGSIEVSGDSAKVYITNSPSLKVNGKTANNWRNIYIDGKRTFEFLSTTTHPNLSIITAQSFVKVENETLYMQIVQAGETVEIPNGATIFSVGGLNGLSLRTPVQRVHVFGESTPMLIGLADVSINNGMMKGVITWQSQTSNSVSAIYMLESTLCLENY